MINLCVLFEHVNKIVYADQIWNEQFSTLYNFQFWHAGSESFTSHGVQSRRKKVKYNTKKRINQAKWYLCLLWCVRHLLSHLGSLWPISFSADSFSPLDEAQQETCKVRHRIKLIGLIWSMLNIFIYLFVGLHEVKGLFFFSCSNSIIQT